MERERDRNENEGARQNEREWEGDARGRDSGNAGSYRFPESRVASRESASETHARADESKRETASREWRASLSLFSRGNESRRERARGARETRYSASAAFGMYLSLSPALYGYSGDVARASRGFSLSFSLTHSFEPFVVFVCRGVREREREREGGPEVSLVRSGVSWSFDSGV